MRKFLNFIRPETLITIRSPTLNEACEMYGQIATAVAVEGLKAFSARQQCGLPLPNAQGQPLDEIWRLSLRNESQIMSMAAGIGCNAELGVRLNTSAADDPERAQKLMRGEV